MEDVYEDTLRLDKLAEPWKTAVWRRKTVHEDSIKTLHTPYFYLSHHIPPVQRYRSLCFPYIPSLNSSVFPLFLTSKQIRLKKKEAFFCGSIAEIKNR